MTRRSLQPLPPNSLPLSFHLYPAQSSSLPSPIACLSAELPLRSHPDRPPASFIEDFTSNELPRPAVKVVRILDPEHREPFISLSRIFFACSLTPIEGLIRFSLKRPTYESSLGGLAPFDDLWVSLLLAREIAGELNVLDELAGLLEWESREAWTVEDKEVGGIVHNWKIPTDKIDPSKYSTEAMLSTPFHRIHLLPCGSQVRTLASPSSTTQNPPTSTLIPLNHYTLHSKIVEWSVLEYERYLDDDFSDPPAPNPTNLTLGLLSTTLLSTIHLSPPSLLSPTTFPETSGSAILVEKVKIERKDIFGAKGKLGLVFCVAKIVDGVWRSELEERRGVRRVEEEQEGEDEWKTNVEQRLRGLEEEGRIKLGYRGGKERETEVGLEELRSRLGEVERRLLDVANNPPPSTLRERAMPQPDLASKLFLTQMLCVVLGLLLFLSLYSSYIA